MADLWRKMRILGLQPNKNCTICQKYCSTLTEIILSPTELPSSPGWLMKDKEPTYILKEVNIFNYKSDLGAILD